MNINMIIWILLFLAFIVLEAISVQLVSIWLGIGAIVALCAATLNASTTVQIILFIFVSAITLILTRPIVKKLKIQKQPTNTDKYIGEIVRVTKEINNIDGKGSVYIYGTEWTARSENGEKISEGTLVEILRIEGVKVIVKKVETETSDINSKKE